MAKKSAVNRNEMVKRLVKQYAAKRNALKAIANDENLSARRALRGAAEAGGAAAQLVARPASAIAARSPAVRAPSIAN